MQNVMVAMITNLKDGGLYDSLLNVMARHVTSFHVMSCHVMAGRVPGLPLCSAWSRGSQLPN